MLTFVRDNKRKIDSDNAWIMLTFVRDNKRKIDSDNAWFISSQTISVNEAVIEWTEEKKMIVCWE